MRGIRRHSFSLLLAKTKEKGYKNRKVNEFSVKKVKEYPIILNSLYLSGVAKVLVIKLMNLKLLDNIS